MDLGQESEKYSHHVNLYCLAHEETEGKDGQAPQLRAPDSQLQVYALAQRVQLSPGKESPHAHSTDRSLSQPTPSSFLVMAP